MEMPFQVEIPFQVDELLEFVGDERRTVILRNDKSPELEVAYSLRGNCKNLSQGSIALYKTSELGNRDREIIRLRSKTDAELHEELHLFWMKFEGKSAEIYYNLFMELNNQKHVLQRDAIHPLAGSESTIGDHFLELREIYNNEAKLDNLAIIDDLTASNLVSDILTKMIRASHLKKMRVVPDDIRAIRAEIEKNYDHHITLEELSNKYMLSVSSILYKFKEYYGTTPANYVVTLRIAKARELLTKTDLSIGEISRVVGVEDIGQFSNLFKKQVGISPLKYRKTNVAIK